MTGHYWAFQILWVGVALFVVAVVGALVTDGRNRLGRTAVFALATLGAWFVVVGFLVGTVRLVRAVVG